ncbi:MAG: polymer-forming cytoskeletal protein [Gloeobacteraceae cyanobacterium ES-bin-144]|nr:polymer-forming cytoskeletal protein [Verrucomicrobiales bacterium]
MADEPQRHRIEVACPECGHTQLEPALVVSTQCRACRANFKVLDGKGVVRAKTITRLAKPRKDGDSEPTHLVAKKQTALAPPNSEIKAPQSFLMRLLRPIKPSREISCFNCSHTFIANGEAQSSQCPKCSGYISLLDYSITGHWNRRVQTRGNVVIQKNATVSGVSLSCHDLTVLGGLAGSVDCSGDLIIRSHGKIIGTVHCKNLRVEKGARVEFLNPVTADTAYIDGQVRGQISCTGTVTLEKRAQLHGLVRTSSFIVKPGAKHTGTVEMLTTPANPDH